MMKADIARIGEELRNNQGCLMKIVEYNKYSDIVVEFQDKYGAKVHTTYGHFIKGGVKNPYHPSIYGFGIIGEKYLSQINYKHTAEYKSWSNLLRRCFDSNYKEKRHTYKKVTCCDEWLLFENFYEWLHSQENFEKWLNSRRWAVDKDIIIKGNKVYSPKNCCLVPPNVNGLFAKNDIDRGDLPIGVSKHGNGFRALCQNPCINKVEQLGTYQTPEEAFLAYKEYKESLIKQVAELEYSQGNITKQCYDAMMNYVVEIDD